MVIKMAAEQREKIKQAMAPLRKLAPTTLTVSEEEASACNPLRRKSLTPPKVNVSEHSKSEKAKIPHAGGTKAAEITSHRRNGTKLNPHQSLQGEPCGELRSRR